MFYCILLYSLESRPLCNYYANGADDARCYGGDGRGHFPSLPTPSRISSLKSSMPYPVPLDMLRIPPTTFAQFPFAVAVVVAVPVLALFLLL